jgi:hypothetical protein
MKYNLTMADIKEMASYNLRCDKSRIVIRKKLISERVQIRGPIDDNICGYLLPLKDNTLYYCESVSFNVVSPSHMWISENIIREYFGERVIKDYEVPIGELVTQELSFLTSLYYEFSPADKAPDFIFDVKAMYFEINLI